MTAKQSPCGKSREYHRRNAWAWECSHPDCAFRRREPMLAGPTTAKPRDDNDREAQQAPDHLQDTP